LKEKEKVKEACPDEDKAILERASKVAAILEANNVKYKTETEKAEAILSFTKSNLSEEEIAFLARTLSPDYKINSTKSVGVF
jgi:uncharacterized protein (DUF1697 family)